MNPRSHPKLVLSPFVAGSFAVIGVTGLLLLADIENGTITFLHEVFGIAFLAAGLLHLLLNWRPLAAYLRQRSGAASLGSAALLALLVFAAGLMTPEHHRRGHHGRAATVEAE